MASLVPATRLYSSENNTEQKETSLSDDNNKLQQENRDYTTEVAALKSEIENSVNRISDLGNFFFSDMSRYL